MRRREFLSSLGTASILPVFAAVDTANNSLGIEKVITNAGDPANPLTIKYTVPNEKPMPSPEDCLRVDPLEINLGVDLVPLVNPNKSGDLLDRIVRLRKEVASEIGIVLPKVRIRDSPALEATQYEFRIDGQSIAKWELYPEHYLALEGDKVTEKVRGIEILEPAYATPALWIEGKDKEQAQNYGYTVVEPNAVMMTHFIETVRRHADEILTVDMTQDMLEHLRKTSPVVVDELVPNVLQLAQVRTILQLLLRELIPICQLETILGVLLEYGTRTKDPVLLTTFVRMKLARTICTRYRDENNVLRVVMLDPALEEQIRAGFEYGQNGLFVRMSPIAIAHLCKKIFSEAEKLTSQNYPAIVLVNPSIRAALKSMTSAALPGLVVLSLAEITHDTQVSSYGYVTALDEQIHENTIDAIKKGLAGQRQRMEVIARNIEAAVRQNNGDGAQ